MTELTQEDMFLFNSIRKYNAAPRQLQKDVILHSVGVRAKLIRRRRSPCPELTPEERRIVLRHLETFLEAQGVEVLLRKAGSPAAPQ
jgi:hypothetical protein